MPVGLKKPGSLEAINGLRLCAVHSGIKPDASKKDLVLIELSSSSSLAAVFTTNKFCAAPVVVAKEHLASGDPLRYLVINSGNANAGTGEAGYRDALQCCEEIARYRELPRSSVLPFSTGVIAARLPVVNIIQSLPLLFEQLHPDRWLDAAQGIMTTDTLPKAISEQVDIQGKKVTITGIAKGSGMIKPDMATLLAFVATDAAIDRTLLQTINKQVVNCSFNSITVDGDTSTNDACVLIATGESGVTIDENTQGFVSALTRVYQHLAQSIIRDAEGATKFVEIEVQGAKSMADAREVGYTIAHSPLVKTALFASDPNWGRILAAIGRARIENLDVSRVSLYLGTTCLLTNGLPDNTYREELGQIEMDREEIRIVVNLGQGEQTATIWTSDLSYDYVKINAEYRS
ncbi:MAG: bifunctional glutamate N-acetyltransferase/amino-acid acetyltransferase ArgJ [Gammaproteobacteria bacterium]